MFRSCPQCGGLNAEPYDMDGWRCPDCGRTFPTGAFTCKAQGCEDWVDGFGDYCARHQAQRDRASKS